MSGRLQSFVANLLRHAGADLEPIEPEGLEVLLPLEVQQALALPEMARLGFATELPKGAQRVGLESDWLERLQNVMGQRGQWLRATWNLEGVSAPTNPERILNRGLILDNAISRLLSVQSAHSRYLVLIFRYTAVSEEKREGVVRLCFNSATGANLSEMVDDLLRGFFAHMEEQEVSESLFSAADIWDVPELWDAVKLQKAVQHVLPGQIQHKLDKFLQGLNRRQSRDLQRLHDYFSDMRREVFLRRTGRARKVKKDEKIAYSDDPEEQQRQKLRLEVIDREYHAKVTDLRQKYALTVNVEFVQGMVLTMPVYRFELLIKRRKGERHVNMDYNPVLRKLEPPPCEQSFAPMLRRLVCDDALHLVSSEAHAPCSVCGKAFCRVCSVAGCPKCKKR